MEQRTCNIIMCCKGHCKLAGENAPHREADGNDFERGAV